MAKKKEVAEMKNEVLLRAYLRKHNREPKGVLKRNTTTMPVNNKHLQKS
jgi:hypothetical protein